MEWVRKKVKQFPGGRGAFVAPTAADARDVMVEGESGIMRVCPPGERPHYSPTYRRLTFPNGCTILLFSADEPERLRGPQNHFAVGDEVAAWKYPQYTLDMLMLGMRLGRVPQVLFGTTPKNIHVIVSLFNDPTVIKLHGSTYENRQNLAEAFFEDIIRKYEGTNLGEQELMGRIIPDNERALWKRDVIESGRVDESVVPDLDRIVIAIDPAMRSASSIRNRTVNETGIIVAGHSKSNSTTYVIEDGTIIGTPEQWASAAIKLYEKYQADAIIAETNNGGDMVETTIRIVDSKVPFKSVVATRGKKTRAEPIAALYERGLVKHVGYFPQLEDQMCSWEIGDPSPDRMDAMVWAVTELALSNTQRTEMVQARFRWEIR